MGNVIKFLTVWFTSMALSFAVLNIFDITSLVAVGLIGFLMPFPVGYLFFKLTNDGVINENQHNNL